jgi:hypothetical protein
VPMVLSILWIIIDSDGYDDFYGVLDSFSFVCSISFSFLHRMFRVSIFCFSRCYLYLSTHNDSLDVEDIIHQKV